jgi:microcompartment protein CcmK/EutM
VDGRTTSLSSAGTSAVRGEVVRNDRATPLAGAKLVLVSADDAKTREYATADEFGRFDLSVPAGIWHLYVGDGNGRAGFHKTVKLTPADERTFTVVSR